MNSVLFFFFVVLMFVGCSPKLTSNKLVDYPSQAVLLFKDKDGVYEFDWATQKEKVVFKANDKQIFREEPFRYANDTLTFAVKGNLTYDKDHNESYFDDYISLDLKSGHSWNSHRTTYQVSKDILKITYDTINKAGIFGVKSEVSKRHHNSSYTYKGPTYNKPRFYSTSTLGNKTVFTSKGSLFLVNELDTIALIKYQGDFDFKFGGGFFQPQICPTGQFVIFRYLPGYTDSKERQSLQRIDLSTKEIAKIKGGGFGSPTFSKDGNFILFTRNQRYKRKNKTWLSSVYVLDLRTNTERRIGEADIASWK